MDTSGSEILFFSVMNKTCFNGLLLSFRYHIFLHQMIYTRRLLFQIHDLELLKGHTDNLTHIINVLFLLRVFLCSSETCSIFLSYSQHSLCFISVTFPWSMA